MMMIEVYAIINATPDSFYSGSRVLCREQIAQAARTAIAQGADVLDVGGYSTRPGHSEVSAEEEYRRLSGAISVIREECGDAVRLSVDTFRAGIVDRLYDKFGEFVVNDVSGGCPEMFETVGKRGLSYVMMSNHATINEIVDFFERQIPMAKEYGVRDIMVDPGFGFGKSVDQNFDLLHRLSELKRFDGTALFVGLSRKSLIWRTLNSTPQESLNGTTVLHTIALQQGADILRVHDTAQAKECIKLFEATTKHRD